MKKLLYTLFFGMSAFSNSQQTAVSLKNLEGKTFSNNKHLLIKNPHHKANTSIKVECRTKGNVSFTPVVHVKQKSDSASVALYDINFSALPDRVICYLTVTDSDSHQQKQEHSSQDNTTYFKSFSSSNYYSSTRVQFCVEPANKDHTKDSKK